MAGCSGAARTRAPPQGDAAHRAARRRVPGADHGPGHRARMPAGAIANISAAKQGRRGLRHRRTPRPTALGAASVLAALAIGAGSLTGAASAAPPGGGGGLPGQCRRHRRRTFAPTRTSQSVALICSIRFVRPYSDTFY